MVNKNTKLKLALFFVTIFALLFRLFGGIYVHDEFAEKNFFIKHRPTWKWKFSSPRGMSDLDFDDMTEEQKTEQNYWDEFIKGKQPL